MEEEGAEYRIDEVSGPVDVVEVFEVFEMFEIKFSGRFTDVKSVRCKRPHHAANSFTTSRSAAV